MKYVASSRERNTPIYSAYRLQIQKAKASILCNREERARGLYNSYPEMSQGVFTPRSEDKTGILLMTLYKC